MEEKIKQLISRYVEFLRRNPENRYEVFKWEAIMHFHKHWNPDAENFWEMFRQALKSKYKNKLIHQFSYSFFEKLGQYNSELLKKCILALYDEKVDLKTRFIRHWECAEKYMEILNKIQKRRDKHQQNDRTIAYLLTLRFPERHYFYMKDAYKALCKYTGDKVKNEFYYNYEHYSNIGNQFLPHIQNNEELQTLANNFIPEGFGFDSSRLLFQDMVFQLLLHNNDQVDIMEIQVDIMEILKNPGNRKFWLYAPGENASKWDEFYQKGIMGLGWDAIGDLKQYDTVEAIRKAIQQADNEPDNKKTNDVLANDEFLNTMQPGDIVIAKKGLSKLIGYGEVVSDYKYDKSRTNYQKIREVNWLKKGEWQAPNYLPMKTLTEIDVDSARKYIGVMEGEISPEPSNNYSDSNFPLNQILYGPPGTGKTYKTKQVAVEIIDGKAPEDREQLNKRYNELVSAGQIAFVSFHQSMNYEDFIEGIKPDLNNKKEITYKIEDGILKTMTDRALRNKKSELPPFDELYDSFITYLKEIKDDKQKNCFPNKRGGCIEVVSFKKRNGKTSIRAFPSGSKQLEDEKNATFINYEDFYNLYSYITENKLDFNTISHKDINEITGKKSRETELIALFKGFLSFIKKVKKENSKQNYVLIIDEINRANVSAVFGELISLIEPDKRLGAEETLQAKLPYSKTDFSVPDNLFIIGTMNTADRSVEALDTALRRRFSFFELMPDPGIFEQLGEAGEIFPGIKKSDILKTINKRIEVLLDRDHTIGHSYLIGVNTPEELAKAFNDKILPLLQEYFYGDYAKIGKVLGKSFVDKIATSNVAFADFEPSYAPDYKENLYRLKHITAENAEEAMQNLLNISRDEK